MYKRQHERVAFDTDVTLRFVDKEEVVCQAIDVSLGGIRITYKEIKILYGYIGSQCVAEFVVGSSTDIEGEQFLVQVKASIVNADPNGIGLKFEVVDQEILALLERLIIKPFSQNDLGPLENKTGVSVRTPHSKILKIELEECIVESVKEIFIAFLSIDITPGPYVERSDFDDYKPPETDVTGIVMFSGALEGGVHLAAPLHFAVKSSGAMIGEAGLELKEQQDDMVWDAFGEITNQVAGGIQTRLASSFEDISMSAPNIVIGSNFRINYRKNFSSVRQFFRTPFGPFFVECFFS